MIYAVIPFDSEENITRQLNSLEQPVYFGEAPKAYFVSYNGTTSELANAVGLKEGGTSRGIVIPVTNYFGFANRDLWEWGARQNFEIIL